MKAALVLALVLSILGRKGAFAQTCPICGDGWELTNSGGVVALPAPDFLVESMTCEALFAAAESGEIDATQCTIVQPLVIPKCACTPIATSSTDAPTSTTSPGCITDIDVINRKEESLSEGEKEVERTYILCPDTFFPMGLGDNDNPGGYIGGAHPLYPSPNTHFKCGEDGLLVNNCVIFGGDFAVVAFGDDATIKNVQFEGIVFEKHHRGAFLLAEPGDLTFKNCIFRDMQNVGPILSLYNTPTVRRLKQGGLTGDRGKDLAKLMNLIESGGEERYDETNRDLQQQNSDFLTSLSMIFIDCVFEGFTPVPPDPYARSGIITATHPGTRFVFERVIFRNNLYGAAEQASTYAVETPGPVTITDSCFENNDFKRLAPIVVIGSPDIIANNNFGTEDDNLACTLIGQFPDKLSLEAIANFTCYNFDAAACSQTPTDAPTEEPSGAFTSPVLRWIVSAAFLGALLL